MPDHSRDKRKYYLLGDRLRIVSYVNRLKYWHYYLLLSVPCNRNIINDSSPLQTLQRNEEIQLVAHVDQSCTRRLSYLVVLDRKGIALFVRSSCTRAVVLFKLYHHLVQWPTSHFCIALPPWEFDTSTRCSSTRSVSYLLLNSSFSDDNHDRLVSPSTCHVIHNRLQFNFDSPISKLAVVGIHFTYALSHMGCFSQLKRYCYYSSHATWLRDACRVNQED